MTKEELIEKFPAMEPKDDDSHLQHMACPGCGNRDSFKVAFQGTCEVFENGTEDCGDHEWDDKSACRCPDCFHEGTVADFTFKGLDDLLTERNANATANETSGEV